MRKFLVTLATLALSAGASHAGVLGAVAEDPVVAPIAAPAPAPLPALLPLWTGGYGGFGVTRGRTDTRIEDSRPVCDIEVPEPETPPLPLAFGAATAAASNNNSGCFWPRASGWGVGGFAGYSWQSGNLVFGIEGHLSAQRMRGSHTREVLGGSEGADEFRTEVRGIASLRGRVGVAANRTLFFVTAGPAIANIRYTGYVGIENEGTVSRNARGMMIGVGIEHALAGGWSIRGDLEHYRFRSSDFEIFPIGFSGVRPRINVARLSTVVRF